MERVKRAKPARLSLSKKTNPSIRSCEKKDRARTIKYAVFPRRKGNSSTLAFNGARLYAPRLQGLVRPS